MHLGESGFATLGVWYDRTVRPAFLPAIRFTRPRRSPVHAPDSWFDEACLRWAFAARSVAGRRVFAVGAGRERSAEGRGQRSEVRGRGSEERVRAGEGVHHSVSLRRRRASWRRTTPKPEPPVEIRGEFNSIETTTPGLRICEHLPKLAGVLDRATVIRSMTHRFIDRRLGRLLNPSTFTVLQNLGDFEVHFSARV